MKHFAGMNVRARRRALGLLCACALLGGAVQTGAQAAADDAAAVYTVYEAEEGTLIDTVAANERPGFSGTGYVTAFEQAGQGVEFGVTVEAEGFYPLRIRYASPFGDKTNFVEVNGSTAGEQLFPQTEAFADVDFGQVYLEEGYNRIGLMTYWGYFDVDSIALGPQQPRPEIAPVDSVPVTPNASPETRRLFGYLTSQYGKSVLAGQQRSTSQELDHIYTLTGKLPAMVGFTATDFGENALTWASYGGLIAVEWHWPAPMHGQEFFTAKTDFDVSKAVVPGTVEYSAVLQDIDAMARKLERFKQAGIPVLWRPLHEAEGGWFWWGAKGPEAAKALYRIMFERLTGYNGLDNLIWVWTSSDTVYSKDWYPGDDFVDIVGVDRYLKDGDYSPLMSVYDTLVRMVEGRKLVAYLENGPIPDPRLLKRNKVGWSYFNTWSGKFAMDGVINSVRHLRTVYNHPYVTTLDKLPSEAIYGRKPLPYPAPVKQPGAGN